MFPESNRPVVPVNKKGNITLVVVLSAIVLLLAVAIIVGSFFVSEPLNPAAGLPAQEIDTAKNYYFDELYVIDSYAYVENDEDDMYLYVAFFNDEGKACIASFSPDKDSVLLGKIQAYFNDTTAYIGDLAITAAVDVSNVASLQDDVEGFYHETLADVVSIFNDAGIEAEATELHLKYMGANQAEYDEKQSSEATMLLIVGIVLAVVGVLLLVFAPRNMKKRWAKLEAEAGAQSVVNIQTPETVVNIDVPAPSAPEAPIQEEET